MKCPNCGSIQLEREDSVDVYDCITEQPIADYICEECTMHFQWRKGEKGLKIIWSPRENIPEDMNI